MNKSDLFFEVIKDVIDVGRIGLLRLSYAYDELEHKEQKRGPGHKRSKKIRDKRKLSHYNRMKNIGVR